MIISAEEMLPGGVGLIGTAIGRASGARSDSDMLLTGGMSVIGGLVPKGVALREAKALIGAWGKGTFESTAKLIRHSFDGHGSQVGAKNTYQFLRKAANFSYRGASKTVNQTTGDTTWTRKNGEFIIKNAHGQIVSYGKNTK